MQKLLTLLLVLLGWNVLAQTNTTVTVYNLTDSSKLAGATVEIDFISQSFKNLKATTDANGTVSFSFSGSVAFHLLVSKEGYKPVFTTLSNAPLQLDIYLKPL